MRVVSSTPHTARESRSAHSRVEATSDETPKQNKREQQTFGELEVEHERASADVQSAAREQARRREQEAREHLHFQPMAKLADAAPTQPSIPALGYGAARSWAKKRPSEHPARAAARAGYASAREALRTTATQLKEAKARWVDGEPEAARERVKAALISLRSAVVAGARALKDLARATFATQTA